MLQLRAAPLPGGAVVGLLRDVTEARSLERMRREFVANGDFGGVVEDRSWDETGVPAMNDAIETRSARIHPS